MFHLALDARGQQSPDPHAVYETSCIGCHTTHAADFARQTLAIKADKLVVARSGKELASILKSHRGIKLKPDEITAVSMLFRNGITWGGVFQHRCASCHERAVTFARSTLKLDGDKIVGAKSGRDVAEFLKSHGDATAPEIDTLVAMLKWQLTTAPKP